jgi:hypothetical protein
MILRIACTSTIAITIAAAGWLVPVRSANAVPVCDAPRIKYEISNPRKGNLLTSARGTWVDSVTVPTEAALTQGHTAEVNASINASETGEAGVIFAKASTQLGITVGGSYSWQTSERYAATVPVGHEGRIVIYRDSREFSVAKKQLTADCRYETVYRKRITAPVRSSGPGHDHVVMQIRKLRGPYTTTTMSVREIPLKHKHKG